MALSGKAAQYKANAAAINSKAELFKNAQDGSAWLANKGQTVSIFHVPSGYEVTFKAMMTEFNDSYTSDWQSENVFGRMDPLQSFKQTTRSISLGFNVVASGFDEARSNFERISALVQMLYPVYDAQGLIKNSPFCKISFMNFALGNFTAAGAGANSAEFDGLMGTIDGLNFEPDFEVGVFQLEDAGGRTSPIYPKLFNISFSFVVLHDPRSRPGWFAGNKVRPFNQDYPYGAVTSRFAPGGLAGTDFAESLGKIQDTKIPNHPKKEAAKNRMLWNDKRKGFIPQTKHVKSKLVQQQFDAFEHAKRQAACRKGEGPCG